MHSQPSYPYLEAIEKGVITSQGILLTRFFPSPIMKRMLLSEQVYEYLKGIYFNKPSRSHGDFFSHEDRSLLLDLAKFGISIFGSTSMPMKFSDMFLSLERTLECLFLYQKLKHLFLQPWSEFMDQI